MGEITERIVADGSHALFHDDRGDARAEVRKIAPRRGLGCRVVCHRALAADGQRKVIIAQRTVARGVDAVECDALGAVRGGIGGGIMRRVDKQHPAQLQIHVFIEPAVLEPRVFGERQVFQRGAAVKLLMPAEVGQAVRQIDIFQRGAAREALVLQLLGFIALIIRGVGRDAFGNDDLAQGGAVLEGAALDRVHALGQGDIGQRGAAVEAVAADVLHGGGDVDFLQGGLVLEGAAPDMRRAVGDGDLGGAVAAVVQHAVAHDHQAIGKAFAPRRLGKGEVADRRYAVGDGDVGKRSAAIKGAVADQLGTRGDRGCTQRGAVFKGVFADPLQAGVKGRLCQRGAVLEGRGADCRDA